jgi:hypothetical protein
MPTMTDLGFLRQGETGFEFHYPEHGLVVRGPFAEWVLEAAAEIVAQTEKMRSDGHIDDLKTLAEFGEADEMDVDSAAYDANARFETVPQCTVSMGSMDYKWMSAVGRANEGETEQPIKRIHDMSKTRNDTFLKNVDGVDTTNPEA